MRYSRFASPGSEGSWSQERKKSGPSTKPDHTHPIHANIFPSFFLSSLLFSLPLALSLSLPHRPCLFASVSSPPSLRLFSRPMSLCRCLSADVSPPPFLGCCFSTSVSWSLSLGLCLSAISYLSHVSASLLSLSFCLPASQCLVSLPVLIPPSLGIYISASVSPPFHALSLFSVFRPLSLGLYLSTFPCLVSLFFSVFRPLSLGLCLSPLSLCCLLSQFIFTFCLPDSIFLSTYLSVGISSFFPHYVLSWWEFVKLSRLATHLLRTYLATQLPN